MNLWTKEIIPFIVELLFDIYIIFLLLRFLLQLFQSRLYNPIAHVILVTTQIIVKPFERIIPTYKNINFAVLFVLLLFTIIKLILIVWLRFNGFPYFPAVIPWAIFGLLNLLINIWFYALLLRALLSWLGVTVKNPFFEILVILTEPLLAPLRKFIPPIKGFDITPLILAFVLKALAIIILAPLIERSALWALKSFF